MWTSDNNNILILINWASLGSVGKEFTCNAGDLGLIPGLGRSPGGGHDNPLQYSYLENPTDRGAWLATVHRGTESDTTEVTEHGQHHRGNWMKGTWERCTIFAIFL